MNGPGYWLQIEEYVVEHTDASFTHGACLDCAARMMREAGISVDWANPARPPRKPKADS